MLNTFQTGPGPFVTTLHKILRTASFSTEGNF
jgi:hypothetical protein